MNTKQYLDVYNMIYTRHRCVMNLGLFQGLYLCINIPKRQNIMKQMYQIFFCFKKLGKFTVHFGYLPFVSRSRSRKTRHSNSETMHYLLWWIEITRNWNWLINLNLRASDQGTLNMVPISSKSINVMLINKLKRQKIYVFRYKSFIWNNNTTTLCHNVQWLFLFIYML